MIKFSKKIFIEAWWVILTQLTNLLLNILLISRITFLLGVEEYGTLALAITVQTFLVLIFYGCLNNGVLRFSSSSFRLNKKDRYFITVIKLCVFISIALIIIGVFLSIIFFLINESDYIITMFLILISSIFIGLVEFISSIILAQRNRKFIFLIRFIDLFFKILFVYLFSINSYLDILLILLVSPFINCLGLFFFYKNILPNFSFRFSKFDIFWIKKIYLYSLPFFGWALFSWAQQNSVKWALEAFSSREDIGLFNALYQIGYSPIIVLFGVIMNFLTPIIFQKIEPQKIDNESKDLLKKLFLFSLLSLIFIFIGSFLITPVSNYIIDSIFPSDYSVIKKFVPIFFIASGFYSVASFLTNIPMSLNSTNSLSKPTIFSSSIGIISSIILTFAYGFIGSVYSLLIFGVIYFFSVAITIYKSHLSLKHLN